MAGLLDLFSGRSSDIYGNGLLTPEQRGGLGNIGLLALAGKLGQLAGPSFSPVPDFGAALGQAAGAYGASQEGAGTAALNAILTGQRGRKLEQELDYYKQLGPILARAAQGWPGADGGTAATPETGGTGSTGGGAAAPAGAGGGGGSGTPGTITLDQARQAAVNAGFTGPAIDIAAATGMAESRGNPLAHNTKNEDSYGYMQLNADAHGDKVKTFDLQEQMNQAFKISNGGTNFNPWTMYRNGEYRKYLPQGGTAAAPTAAAPAPAGGGGLLAPTAPNPLSDAEPMLPIARPAAARQQAAAGSGDTGADLLAAGMSPEMVARYLARPAPGAGAAAVAPNQVGRFAGIAPGTPVNSGGFPYNPEITDPAVAARVAQSMAAIKRAQQSGVPWAAPRVSGGGLLAPEDPGAGYGGGPPQGPAGDVGPAGPAGPATPRAPLPTMGPAGIELPPMQGPLAAPAPAAAAPVAPGPGLLSPPGALPAAPALPRVNPAFDAYARQLAVAAGLVKGAGLPDALTPLLDVFKSSPAYRAQQIIAEKGAAQPFEQAQTLFNKQVEIAGVGPIEAAKLPYALAQTYFKAEQDIRTAGPVAAAQNFERIRADNAAKGIITTMGADGQIKLSIDPDAVKAVTGATVTAPKQAEADIARETTRQQQFGDRQGNWRQVDVQGGGKVWVDANGKLITGANGNPYQAQEDPAAQAGRTKLAEQFGQRTIDQLQSAEDAQFGLQNTARVRPLVDKMIAGYGADTRLEFGRALKAAGLSDSDGVVATQTYLINQLDQASRIAKRFGSGAGITERDVENAKQLAGGSAQLDKQTLLNILDMVDRTNRRALELQHQGYDRLTDGGKKTVDPGLYKVPIPIYNPQQMQNLPPGTPILMPDGHSDVVPARK